MKEEREEEQRQRYKAILKEAYENQRREREAEIDKQYKWLEEEKKKERRKLIMEACSKEIFNPEDKGKLLNELIKNTKILIEEEKIQTRIKIP